MNKTIKNLLLLLTVAVATSCGPTLKVSSDYDRTVNFSAYKTYSIYNLKSKGSVNQLNEDRIIKYLNAEMAKRGFTQDNKNPDLMVNALTVLKDRRGVSATSYSYGGFYRPYGYWGAPGYTSVSTYNYKDGSLVIDMIDAKTQKMVWTGAGSAEMYNKPKNPEQTISEVVSKIMEEFPVTAAK